MYPMPSLLLLGTYITMIFILLELINISVLVLTGIHSLLLFA